MRIPQGFSTVTPYFSWKVLTSFFNSSLRHLVLSRLAAT